MSAAPRDDLSISTSARILRLGTRGSSLALAQSRLVADQLRQRHPNLRIETIVIRTSGDRIDHGPLHEFGGKGLFTRELEQALLAGSIDFAVHSFKDVPVTMPLVEPDELMVVAVPPREDPRDVLISLSAKTVRELPEGARVGTGSLRRRAQLLSLRLDVQIMPMRGNIDTRLRKFRECGFDALVLAMAGVRRAALFDPALMHAIDPSDLLPAPAQGALALQCRRGDEQTRDLLSVLNDPTTGQCVEAERELVRLLEGDCHSPIAALAQIRQDGMHLRAAVGGRDGQPPVLTADARGPADAPQRLVQQVFDDLSARGVRKLLHGR